MGLNFELQLHYEAEGAAAALRGVGGDACPYSRETQPGPWNHWVYGHSLALGEKQTFERGTISWCSTSSSDVLFTESVAEAVGRGSWKPRFYSPPDCTTLPTSSGKKP